MAEQVYVLTYTLKGETKARNATCARVARGRGFGPKRDKQGNPVDLHGNKIYKNRCVGEITFKLK